MKAIAASLTSSSCVSKDSTYRAKSKSGRVRKGSKEKREQGKVIEKLRGMVGGDDRSSKLEVMQNVLDYIYSLKAQLESSDQPMGESSELSDLISAFAASLTPKSLSPEPASP